MNPLNVRKNRMSVCVLTVLAAGSAASAGPLNPPAGPIGPTGKTLTEIEPRIALSQANTPGDNDATPSVFKITQPGSYYLTGNINVPGGLTGIEIAASEVTIDLAGYAILDGANGIDTTVSCSNIRISNGSVRGASLSGINLQTADGAYISGLTVRLAGVGLRLGVGTTVEDTRVTNGGTGVRLFGGVVNFRRCLLSNFSGNAVETGAIVSRVTIEDSYIGSANIGLSLTAATRVRLASSNFTLCSGGAYLGAESEVSGCTFDNNDLVGLEIGAGSTVTDNRFEENGGTTQAGLSLSGSGSVVRNNRLTGNGLGVRILTGTGNLVVGNVLSSNGTHFSIVTGNKVGTIFTPSGAGQITGSSGGVAIAGGGDPWGNIVY